MVLGAEGAENEFLSEQNLYDAAQGFPLKINDFGSIVTSCMFLVLLGGISLLGFGKSKVGAKNCSKKYGWERRRCSRK